MGGVDDCEAVSVVIPTHDRSALLKRAIQSCLDQGTACGEIIVVDDHSTDDTADVVASFGDTRVRYLVSPSRGGPAARNRGLREARFEWIKFLDDDDYLLPGALQRQLDDLGSLSPAERSQTVVYGDAVVIRSDQNSIPRFKRMPRRRRRETDVEYLLRVNVLTSCPMHTKTMLDVVGGFDETLRRGQENDLHLRLALSGARFVHRPTLVYVYDRVSVEQRVSTSDVGFQALVNRVERVERRERLLRAAFPDGMSSHLRRILSSQYTACRWEAVDLGASEIEATCAAKVRALRAWPAPMFWIAASKWGHAIRYRLTKIRRLRGLRTDHHVGNRAD